MGLNCTGPLIHRSSINIQLGLSIGWFCNHAINQPRTANLIYNPWLVEICRCSTCGYGGTTMGPEYLQILVSGASPGTNPLWIPRDTCTLKMWGIINPCEALRDSMYGGPWGYSPGWRSRASARQGSSAGVCQSAGWAVRPRRFLCCPIGGHPCSCSHLTPGTTAL